MYNVHTINVNVTYAVTSRFAVRLTVPFVQASQSKFFPDTARHLSRAGGLGDVGVVGTTWLFDPRTHADGNLAIGAGVKLATGTDKYDDLYFTSNHSVIHAPVDQAIEPGDGGWGVILQGQAFRRMSERTFAYFTGSYLLSTRNHSDVPRDPGSAVLYSIPDVYSGRVGVGYTVSRDHGITIGLGGRIDGIPYHDLIGGSEGFRRPGYAAFVDPGVAVERGRTAVTISVPVRIAQRLATSQMTTASGGTIGAGDLAKVVFFVAYARRI
ncbi:MAG TPA: hypothetical protein VFP39_01685 [Gemmatimonadales bacterium]|nr:hypothetical protein [Gemmatimonadales bacterium]